MSIHVNTIYVQYILVGGLPTPLKTMSQSVGKDDIPYIYESNNTENIGFDKKNKKTNKTKPEQTKKTN